MYTFGFSFKTWDNPKSFADAPSILSYLKEAAEEYNVLEKIQYQTQVTDVSFNSDKNQWTVSTLYNGKATKYYSNFLFSCTGYYNYKKGFTPDFKGLNDFKGKIIHPHHDCGAQLASSLPLTMCGGGCRYVRKQAGLLQAGLCRQDNL